MGDSEIPVQTLPTSSDVSLYQRLGGSQIISAVVGELYERMLANPYVWYYWKGRSSERRSYERRRFTDLACLLAGKPVAFPGSDNNFNYRGLDVSRVEWEVFVNLAAEALEQPGLDEGKKDELFSLLTRTKAAITDAERGTSSTGGFAAFPDGLTQREKEVLRLVALGKNNPAIADDLFISVNT